MRSPLTTMNAGATSSRSIRASTLRICRSGSTPVRSLPGWDKMEIAQVQERIIDTASRLLRARRQSRQDSIPQRSLNLITSGWRGQRWNLASGYLRAERGLVLLAVITTRGRR